uniref:Uncharacterized protein isoform X2 n=1 Tax=Pogona vitticeps TaxID=103695 RepID=A0ABM5G3U9_9SAUR
MGPKKGSGPSKGKAPAKKRPAPQVSPQPSSSDEESWPIWQELQGKILALEAQKSVQKVPTPSVVPRKSARESKGKRKAKLAALAQELMQRCDALESLQVTAGDEQEADEGPSAANTVAPRPRRGKAAAPELISPEVELQTESFLSEGPSATTSHPGDAPSTSGSASGTTTIEGRKHAVIIGHSFVYWAARYAASSPWGSDLGLGAHIHITWHGLRGMRWIQLGRLTAFGQSPPDILVIHLGGNDLPASAGKALTLDILRDLKMLKTRYPRMRIVWSTIIPRLAW